MRVKRRVINIYDGEKKEFTIIHVRSVVSCAIYLHTCTFSYRGDGKMSFSVSMVELDLE